MGIPEPSLISRKPYLEVSAAALSLVTAIIGFFAVLAARNAADEANKAAKELNRIAEETKRTIQILGSQAVKSTETANSLAATANRISEEMQKIVSRQVRESEKLNQLFDAQIQLLDDYRLSNLHVEFRQALDAAEQSWPCGCTSCGAEADVFRLKSHLARANQLERHLRARLSAIDYLKYNLLGSVVWPAAKHVENCTRGFAVAQRANDSYELHLALMLLAHAEFAEVFELNRLGRDKSIRMIQLESARSHYKQSIQLLGGKAGNEEIKLYLQWIQLELSCGNLQEAKRLGVYVSPDCEEASMLKVIESKGVNQQPSWLPCWKLLIGGKVPEKFGAFSDKALAVRDLPIPGVLLIENRTGHKRDVVVNGVTYGIGPGWSELWISHGIVYAHLAQEEPLKRFSLRNWSWNGHNWQMKLVIQDKSLRPTGWTYDSTDVEEIQSKEYPSSASPMVAPTPARRSVPQPTPAPTQGNE